MVLPSLEMPTVLYFGGGRFADLPAVVAQYGREALIVAGPGILAGLAEKAAEKLREAGMRAEVAAVVAGEPTLATADEAAAAARRLGEPVVVGIGGGSCLDTAKAAAFLAPAGRPAADFFHGAEPPGPGLPWVAVPTTAGSGAEVTPNAVLIDQASGVKQSIRARHMYARAAVIDPDLALTLPPVRTAYSGLDALSHAVEAFASRGANDLTDVMALEAARLAAAHLGRAYADGNDREARAALAKAATLAGLALANARLGAVHGLAHPIGARYGLPHGLVCGVLLPQVMRYNLQESHDKYARLAEVWGVAGGGDVFDRAAAAVRYILGLLRRLGLPSTLGPLGLAEGDLPWIVRQSLASPSLAANPRPAGEAELLALLRENLRQGG